MPAIRTLPARPGGSVKIKYQYGIALLYQFGINTPSNNATGTAGVEVGMNSQAKDIDQAIAALLALKEKTRKPQLLTMRRQIDSYHFEKDIAQEASKIVCALMTNVCASAAQLGNASEAELSDISDQFDCSMHDTLGNIFYSTDQWCVDVLDEEAA